jgi:hypothetical protein
MDPLANEEPRSKLLGIFVGVEIYFGVVNFPEQAQTKGLTGYGPRLPIK